MLTSYMVMFHRFSPRTNGGIKRLGTKRTILPPIGKKCKIREKHLISQLIEMGYTYEIASGCIPYLEFYEINAALTVINNLLERN